MAATGGLLYLTYWRELGGQPLGREGVNGLFCSAHFSELPLPFVNCRLNAHLLTGNEPIAPGDPMDVELLSVALPLAHFVLADRRMELRIKQLGLDRKCGTRVYSMSAIRRTLPRLIDIKAIDRALSNSEWKAATVVAGSAIEALLLWELQNRRQATYTAAVSDLVANKTFQKQPPSDPEDWVLHHYIEVTAHLKVIKPDTAKEARLAKDFRNLIHPGRAQRLGQTCDRGTALSSVAALEHVVRDLTPP